LSSQRPVTVLVRFEATTQTAPAAATDVAHTSCADAFGEAAEKIKVENPAAGPSIDPQPKDQRGLHSALAARATSKAAVS
jgi:hypothetical protein